MKHQFNTSATATKTSSQSWVQIGENSSYSQYYTADDPDNGEDGSHYTYLVYASGTKLTSTGQTVESGGNITFKKTDMDKNSDSNTVKLQIHNTKYSTTKQILKARGLLTGVAS